MQDEKEKLQTLKVDEIEDFIQLQGYKPLTKKEIEIGREKINIFGTDEPMPWETIFTRMSSGQPLAEIVYQYGNGRKICLFAFENGIELDIELVDLVDREVEVRKDLQEVAVRSPNEAMTLLQRVNEKYPDFQTNVAVFADKLVNKAIDKLDGKEEAEIDPGDMEKVAKAVQIATDIVGVTQRHSAGVSISAGAVKVEGFEFVLDVPVEVEAVEEAVEADIEEVTE